VPRQTILVVEDNPLNRELMRQLLEDDYTITTAVDGAAGVALAVQQLPDVILMDLSMPGVDGFEAQRRLRAHDKTKHIPIIAVTAHAIRGDRERVLRLGFDGYVSKPVDEDQLTTAIRSALPRPR
jgi:CheY-like chemotaxis protein